jgi:hypothetical protein
MNLTRREWLSVTERGIGLRGILRTAVAAMDISLDMQCRGGPVFGSRRIVFGYVFERRAGTFRVGGVA